MELQTLRMKRPTMRTTKLLRLTVNIPPFHIRVMVIRVLTPKQAVSCRLDSHFKDSEYPSYVSNVLLSMKLHHPDPVSQTMIIPY